MAPRLRDANGRYTTVEKEARRLINGAVQKGPFPLTAEMGVQTPKKVGRNLYDDFLTDLNGTQALKVYREMAENHPIISGILLAIEMLLREVTWTVEPGGESPQDIEAADFLTGCMEDMAHTWQDHIAATTTMIPYGFAPFELVYRPRNPRNGSRYDDGKIGWRKFGFRPQHSIVAIDTDPHGGPRSITQQTDSGLAVIPIEKALLYRTTENGGPTGRSLLRGAYTSYYFQKRAQELMLIGLQRDLVGLVVAEIPADDILDQTAAYEYIRKIVTRTSVDEQMGIVWPREFNTDGEQLHTLRTLDSSGRAKIDVRQVVRDFAGDIAASLLADFMLLGRDAVGSRALADPKQELFQLALDAVADSQASVLNRFAVPRLFALNAFNVETLPRFVHEPVRDVALADIAAYIKDVAGAGGMVFSGEEDDPVLRRVLGFAGLDRPAQ